MIIVRKDFLKNTKIKWEHNISKVLGYNLNNPQWKMCT